MLGGGLLDRQKQSQEPRGFSPFVRCWHEGNNVAVDGGGLSRLWKKLHESSSQEPLPSGCDAEKYGLALFVLLICVPVRASVA